jgi:drug/metabolite transporter (DMT)-like permease
MAMINNLKFKKSHISDAITGMVTILGINIFIMFLFLGLNTISPTFMSVVFSIGLVQVVYFIPLMRWSIKRRIRGFTKGLILGALTTGVVNFGCFLVTLKYMSTAGQ